MISSNGLIIIEMVSSETVDRGTVLFILKGETCLNGICHGAFGEVYGRSICRALPVEKGITKKKRVP